MTNLGGKVIFFSLFAFSALAQVATDQSSWGDEIIAIYGDACEPVKGSESRSSVRLRATDKASFKAIENISALDNFKKKMNEHDFNVWVYSLVDNNVSDLAVRTTKADKENICVEVTGYILPQDLNIATLPQNVKKVEVKKVEPIVSSQENAQPDGFKNPLVFVADTVFFDGSVSKANAKELKKLFDKGDNFYITPRKELADYVIYSRVLRAKIDPINSSTHRLQMVVSLEIENAETKELIKEHQNKFVLFNSKDDEQQEAKKLMDKLFLQASQPIIKKLENMSLKKTSPEKLPSVISPVMHRK